MHRINSEMDNLASPIRTMWRSRRTKRRGTIYVAVIGTAVIVALIGLSGLMLVRIERRISTEGKNLSDASLLAQSAIEHAITVLSKDTNWRSTYTHNSWQATQSFGAGSFKWKLVANSGNLASPADGAVKIVGEGRVNAALQEHTVKITGGTPSEEGPGELRSYDSVASISEARLTSVNRWAQYFKPTLPANAIGWKVTSVELHCKQDGLATEAINLRLYKPLGNNMPSATVLDSVTTLEINLPSSTAWHTFNFGGSYSHGPNEGMCLAIESTISLGYAMSFEYQAAGVTESDSGFIVGTPSWQSIVTNKAVLYKIHGTYTAVSPTEIVAGTWSIE